MDKAHRDTDKRLEELEAELDTYYSKVAQKVVKQSASTLASYYRQQSDMRQAYEDGQIDYDEYKNWLRKQSTSATERKAVKEASKEIVNADKKAVDIVTGALAGIYVTNRLASMKEAKSQLKDKGFSISSRLERNDNPKAIREWYKQRYEKEPLEKKLYPKITGDKESLTYKAKVKREEARLAKLGKKKESSKQKETKKKETKPKETKPKLNKKKDQRWTEQHLESVFQAGMRAGHSPDKIANDILRAIGMNKRSADRIAGTWFTRTEAQARYDEILDLVNDGYEVMKEWKSHHDKKVRKTHEAQDGEVIDVEATFPNGLLYPGDDSTNDPGEFMNCRCELRFEIVGEPKEE